MVRAGAPDGARGGNNVSLQILTKCVSSGDMVTEGAFSVVDDTTVSGYGNAFLSTLPFGVNGIRIKGANTNNK